MIKRVNSGGSADVFNLGGVEMELDLNKRGKKKPLCPVDRQD